ncbi:MAG: DHH family phosphoesterase [Lachnospiraceae bacterium]|nr:DHH family phosphoesterase [Lachnospiraceae bacterium]
MKRYNPERLQQELQNQLHASPQTLQEWLHSPFYLDGDLVSEFWRHIKNAPKVAIVGDYDVDGVCAAFETIKAIKEVCPGKPIYARLPRRFSEGYGMNQNIVNEIKEKCPKGSVVITVDNGISAADLLEGLEKDGYTVLMTDHHELKEGCRIPNVTMAIDPVVPGCDRGFSFTKWCGAAIAFKLAEQMVSESLAHELQTYAGLATVADCMELNGGNWGLVKKALQDFRNGTAPEPLKNIMKGLKQNPDFATEDSFGFYIGPCLNAGGRLLDNGATESLKYLLNPTQEQLERLVNLNLQRRALKEEQYGIVKQYVEDNHLQENSMLWVALPNLHEGIVGILAGSLVEEYKMPAIVLTNIADDPNILKGSGRSVEGVNLFEYLNSLDEGTFISMGGHPGAAGMKLTREKFEIAKNVPCERPVVAAEVVPSNRWHTTKDQIPEIYQLLQDYLPFGEGNPAPLFDISIDMMRDDVRMIGAEKNHLCIQGKNENDEAYKITHWRHDESDLSNPRSFGLYGRISGTNYMGIETPTLNADGVYDPTAEDLELS